MNTRSNQSIDARNVIIGDFFGGWEPKDREILTKYMHETQSEDGYITDFLGVRTSAAHAPWAGHLVGSVAADIPIPDDGYKADTMEYVALLSSIDAASQQQYSMIELGASYAPWTCAAGVLAMRKGVEKIRLCSVEASSFFRQHIEENFAKNGLRNPPEGVSVDIRVITGAVSTRRNEMFFPLVTSASQNDGMACGDNVDVDYLGRKVTCEKVTGYALDEILGDMGIVDFMHCDIQGAEREVLLGGAALLSQRVKSIFVGTHSRSIEGALIECFHAYGWSLIRERPVQFAHRHDMHSVIGMTTRDGGQFWVNRRFI